MGSPTGPPARAYTTHSRRVTSASDPRSTYSPWAANRTIPRLLLLRNPVSAPPPYPIQHPEPAPTCICGKSGQGRCGTRLPEGEGGGYSNKSERSLPRTAPPTKCPRRPANYPPTKRPYRSTTTSPTKRPRRPSPAYAQSSGAYVPTFPADGSEAQKIGVRREQFDLEASNMISLRYHTGTTVCSATTLPRQKA